MKRISLIALCVMMLCSLLLLVNVGTTMAYLSSYSYEEFSGLPITFDGKWTSSSEWTIAPWQTISATAKFTGVFDMSAGTFQCNIIELLSDNTTDAGDYWQICMQNAASGPAAPDSSSYRIELVGHTTLKVYQGNGTGWTLLSTPPDGFAIKDSLSTSPTSSAPHWVCEIQIDKTNSPVTNQPPIGIRVAAYDASNAAAGEQAWPPNSVSSVNNPSQWGSISGYGGEIPEGFSFGIVALLSSVVVLVSAFGFRKRRITKLAP